MAIAPKKIRKAIGGLKDQTSIGIAKVGVGGTKAPDLDVALVKATSHDDFFDEKHVSEILHLTAYSRGYVNACVTSLSKRLYKTRDWHVALKSLMLTHRLLRDGDPSFEDELIHTSRNGRRILNLSDFKDETHSNAWDYSTFVRTYGFYLNDRLDCAVQFTGKSKPRRSRGGERGGDRGSERGGDRGSERGGDRGSYRGRTAYSKSPVRTTYKDLPGATSRGSRARSPDARGYAYSDDRRHSNYDGGLSPRYGDRSRRRDDWDEKKEEDVDDNVPIKEMAVKQLLEKMPAMQRLMERVINCRPAGVAKTNRLVQHALYPVIKESIQLHRDISDGCAVLLEHFFDMEQKERVKAFEIYYTYSKQGDQLHEFFKLCKHHGVGRSSEYIEIEPVPQEQLDNLEDYLRSNAPNRNKSKSPEPEPLQIEYRPETPEREPEPEPRAFTPEPAPAPVEEPPAFVAEPEPAPPRQTEGDLLDLDKATISADDHSDRLALALFSTSTSTTTTNWESFNSPEDEQNALQLANASEGKAGWELALVSSVTNISKPMPANRPLAGGFDPLLLDSMYSQGEVLQKQAVSAVPAGSASSVAIPNRPASAFLALPAPPGGMPLAVNGEDPFAASAVVPPPAYVQMADLATKRELLTQEQVMWQRYQMEGMRGEAGFQKLFNNPYAGMPAPTPMMYQNPYQVGMP
ncbi:hypothetical protein M758_10G062400 [Ceratodon purpureus]|nr:hypothetical protein M758_10G062400 [Ceratodon purpureus]